MCVTLPIATDAFCVHFQLLTEEFNIYDLVKDMRTQRPSVVQTKVVFSLRVLRRVFTYNHVYKHIRCDRLLLVCVFTS